ncbi:MAG: hypothetical protein JWN76_587 [Chitinophagaceae bacterium]|nr:hypothetical protein [Chitinophagaceae bacterium]
MTNHPIKTATQIQLNKTYGYLIVLPFSGISRKGGAVGQFNMDVLISHDNLVRNRFHNRALFFECHVRPVVIEGLCIGEDSIGGELLNAPEINGCLQLGQLLV